MSTDFKPLMFLCCLIAALCLSLLLPTVAFVFYGAMLGLAYGNSRAGSARDRVWLINAAGMFAVAALRFVSYQFG